MANGHHWDPRWPEPPFPGRVRRASSSTPTTTRRPTGYEGKNVLVLGIGNSACDIAVETSRVSNDLPGDAPRRLGDPQVLRLDAARRAGAGVARRARALLGSRAMWRSCAAIKATNGHPEDFGLPTPDHKLGEAHPTISSDLLRAHRARPRSGQAQHRAARGHAVRFVDGSVEQIDRIVYCTGYKISFPFLDHDLLDPPGTTRSSSTGGWSTRTCRASTSSGSCSRWARSCRSPSCQSEWVADVLQGRRGPAGRDDHGRGDRARAAGDAQALRGVQASHDPGGLRPTCAFCGASASAPKA